MEALPLESVTTMVQLEYVAKARVLKLMVLLPKVALVVAEVQEPPYEIVPTSLVVKV